MGWSGPREGYRNIQAAIADQFKAEHIDAQHIVSAGLAWLLLSPAVSRNGEPLIVCVLLDRGLVKVMSTNEGPYYHGCPLAWYERAPEFTEYGYDRAWRARNLAAATQAERDEHSERERAERRAHETAIPAGSRYYAGESD